MIRYADNYNPIREYWDKIQSGEETVGAKIRKVYKKLAWDLDHPGEYFYSPKRANHILEFAENYCHNYQGKDGGKLVRLELWEKAKKQGAKTRRTMLFTIRTVMCGSSSMCQMMPPTG